MGNFIQNQLTCYPLSSFFIGSVKEYFSHIVASLLKEKYILATLCGQIGGPARANQFYGCQ